MDNSLRVDINDLEILADFWQFDYEDAYNVWWWDYDYSGRVDIGDLGYLVDYWPDYFDLIDFAMFAGYWQREVDQRLWDKRADIVRDGIVDFKDFAVLANEWQEAKESPHPNISVVVSGDPCNLNGEVMIGVDGVSYTTKEALVFLDGEPIGTVEYFFDEEEQQQQNLFLDSRIFRNGVHSLKIVAVDVNGLITLSENVAVNFVNTLSCVVARESFEGGQDYRMSAIYSSGEDLRVKVSGWNGSVVWTSQALSGGINISIPSSSFNGWVYDLSVEKQDGGWESIWGRAIGKKYEPSEHYKFAIFLPRGRTGLSTSSSESRKQAVAEVVRICESFGWPYVVLYRGQCTWENFAEVLSHTSVKYVYLVCHGSSRVGRPLNTVQRTNFWISSRWPWGIDIVVSYKGGLPDNMDASSRVHCMASLGLGERTQLRLVQVDACSQTKFNDMARSWIKFDIPQVEQLYSSYKGVMMLFIPEWQQWSYDLWNYLSDQGNTYWQAYEEIQKSHKNPKGFEISQAVQWHGWDQVRLNW